MVMLLLITFIWSCDHKRDTMTEKGGKVIINAKRFIVNVSNIIIFKIKVKNEKVMLVGKDKL